MRGVLAAWGAARTRGRRWRHARPRRGSAAAGASRSAPATRCSARSAYGRRRSARTQQSFLRAVANVLATALGRLRGERADAPRGAARPADRARQPRAVPRAARSTRWRARGRDDGLARCVLFIDLDDFKAVNDLYGHARRRRAAGRARRGGSWRPCARRTPSRGSAATSSWSSARTSTSARRSRSAIASPRRSTSRWTSTGIEHRLSAQRSGSRSAAAGRRDPDALLADADAAAYRAKAEGRGQRRGLRHAPAPHARSSALRTAAALERRAVDSRRAAARRSSRSSRSATARASGTRRCCAGTAAAAPMLAPADFIPVAEESGADRRDRRVGARAGLPRERGGVRARRTGRRSRSTSRRASSPSRTCGDWSRDALSAAGCRRRALALEVTETALLQVAPIDARATSPRSRSSGVRLVLDDFGTGYSSLRDLRELPVGRSRSTARSSAQHGRPPAGRGDRRRDRLLAPRSGIDVVAEGVEHEEQADAAARDGLPARAGLPLRAPRARGAQRRLRPDPTCRLVPGTCAPPSRAITRTR